MINYVKKDYERFTMVDFEISGGILGPDELSEAMKNFPDVDYTKGVCISGRGPVWLYSALTEKNHPAKFVSTFEPRSNGCIVTSSHDKSVKIGDILPLK